jgi:hypothetical protein
MLRYAENVTTWHQFPLTRKRFVIRDSVEATGHDISASLSLLHTRWNGLEWRTFVNGMDRLWICNTSVQDIQGHKRFTTRGRLTAFHFSRLKPFGLARREGDLHDNARPHTSRLQCSSCSSFARNALPTYHSLQPGPPTSAYHWKTSKENTCDMLTRWTARSTGTNGDYVAFLSICFEYR